MGIERMVISRRVLVMEAKTAHDSSSPSFGLSESPLFMSVTLIFAEIASSNGGTSNPYPPGGAVLGLSTKSEE